MKIEIDLNDIFSDENGSPSESMEESIRRQIMDRLSGDMRKRLFARLDDELAKAMQIQINAAMKERMPSIIEDILNVTYMPVDRYGSKSEPTTFRNEIVKAVSENMKYEPSRDHYSANENAFTKAVKSIIELKTAALQKAIVKEVDDNFKRDAISFAVAKLSERLGLTN